MGNPTKALIMSLTLMFVWVTVYHSTTVLLASLDLNLHLNICLGSVWLAGTLFQYFVYGGGKSFWTPNETVMYCVALRICLQSLRAVDCSAVNIIHTRLIKNIHFVVMVDSNSKFVCADKKTQYFNCLYKRNMNCSLRHVCHVHWMFLQDDKRDRLLLFYYAA